MASLAGDLPDPRPEAGDTFSAGAGVGQDLARRAGTRAAALRASKAWSEPDEADLDERFEAATVAALRVPALAERSANLRRIGRRFVPRPLRPGLHLAARAFDRAAGLALSRLELARRAR